MRSLFSIAILGTAIFLPVTMHAQMRGGMGMGHGMGTGHSSAPRASSGFAGHPAGQRTFASSPRPSTFATTNRFATRSFSHNNRFFFDGRFDGRPDGFRRFHHHRPFGFVNGCFGFSCGSPFFFDSSFAFGAPFIGPYDPFYGNYYPSAPQAQPVVVNADNGNSAQLAAEVQRLTDEVDDLRNETYSQHAAARVPVDPHASLSAKNPALATIFIFRDGHRISAQNYAIAGQTLWIFNEHTARKVPLADLDVPTTEQTNAANGIELRLSPTPTR